MCIVQLCTYCEMLKYYFISGYVPTIERVGRYLPIIYFLNLLILDHSIVKFIGLEYHPLKHFYCICIQKNTTKSIR